MDDNEQQQPEKKRRRRRNVDIQSLRKKLLQTCDDYLSCTPLDSLNAAMIRSIGDVVTSVGADYSKAEKASSPAKALGGFVMPFEPVEDQRPSDVLPMPGMASPANGFPSIPEPSVSGKGTGGGVKAPSNYGSTDDYAGLQRPE